MRFKTLAATLILLALCGVGAHAQQVDTIKIATAGRSFFNYLPITIAEKIGAFSDQNLNVVINDFQGGSKSVEALVGGSVDLVIATYDNTVLLQTKGIPLVAVTLINHSIGAAIAIKKDHVQAGNPASELKGLKFGVTSAGSALQRILLTYLGERGVTLNDVSIIGIGGGAGALAALGSGEIDGFCHVDPVLTEALKSGEWEVLVDTRTPEGMKTIYGGDIVATAAITTPEYLKDHPEIAQKFVSALVNTLKWMSTASIDELMAVVPPEFYTDKAAYREALIAQIKIYSNNGIFPADVVKRTYESMINEGILKSDQTIALQDTYKNTLAEAVAKQ